LHDLFIEKIKKKIKKLRLQRRHIRGLIARPYHFIEKNKEKNKEIAATTAPRSGAHSNKSCSSSPPFTPPPPL